MSEIEWTDETWNPIAGCTMASPGCTNCYAMRMAARLSAMGMEKYKGTTRKSGGRAVWTGKISYDHDALEKPLHWRMPRKVFVNSMSDLFQDGVAASFVEKVWDVMEKTPHHTYQILTKRPDNMSQILHELDREPLSNVWLGTSIENADHLFRLEQLRDINGYLRFISFEPLIGSVGKVDLHEVDWVIVGGESGPGARPMAEEWVDEILDASLLSGSEFFFKQWGGVHKKKAGRAYRGKHWDAWPT